MKDDEYKREEQQENTFIGEVSYPVLVPSLDNSTTIRFKMHSLQNSPIDYGAAQVVTESGIVYPVVIARAKQQQHSMVASSLETEGKQPILVKGISLTQAEQMRRVIQKKLPRKRTFVGELRTPFSFPLLTGKFIGFHVHPTQPLRLLQQNKPVFLVDDHGNRYITTLQSIGRLNPAVSNKTWQSGDFIVAVKMNSLEEAQKMETMIQELGPQDTTTLGTIYDIKRILGITATVNLYVRMLQYGLMHPGPAQISLRSGDTVPITIEHITLLPPDISLKHEELEYIITIRGVLPSQVEEMQTLVQEFE